MFHAHQFIKLLDHRGIIGLGSWVNRYHTGSVTNTQNKMTCYLPMDISCEGCEELDVLHMLLVVEDALIQMTDTPTERDIVVEELTKFCGSLCRIGVTPCTERNQNLLRLIKCHISMHHSRKSNTRQGLYLTAILVKDSFAEVGITVLKTIPYCLSRVSP